jgi:hypothetical protein
MPGKRHTSTENEGSMMFSPRCDRENESLVKKTSNIKSECLIDN